MIPADHDQLMRLYLHAKDQQRPFLFRKVFTEDAFFEARYLFVDRVERAQGLGQITDVFRRLGRDHENVFTVYTSDSVTTDKGQLLNRWLVGMQQRDTGRVSVACGDYRWTFAPDGQRVSALVVGMHHFCTLQTAQTDAALTWLSGLPAPWCTSADVLQEAPAAPELQAHRSYLGDRSHPGEQPPEAATSQLG